MSTLSLLEKMYNLLFVVKVKLILICHILRRLKRLDISYKDIKVKERGNKALTNIKSFKSGG